MQSELPGLPDLRGQLATVPSSWLPESSRRVVEGSGMYPVSVIVPHQEKRAAFFNRFCLPSILSAGPTEVIVVSGEGGASAKRNHGAKIARSDYLMFFDDDCIMAADCLFQMYVTLREEPPSVGYVYCDALEITHPDAPKHPVSPVMHRKSRVFSDRELRRANYISNMSLMRRSVFPGFDETLRRLVDWDVWLSLLDKGIVGKYLPGVYYHAYYLDKGITAGDVSYKEAVEAIRRKRAKA